MTGRLRATLAAVASACLLATAACAEARSPAVTEPRRPTPSATPRPPLRIMPLGDSITDGLQTSGGYRSDLWQYLTADGRSADFVGSRANGPPQLGDRNEEGHPGWRIHQLAVRVREWLRVYRPDVVLLHIGTNDVIQRSALPQAPARLAALVDLITATLPDAQVYVATIVPLADPAGDRLARRYNAAIPGIVSARAARGRHVHLVDMHAALTRADLSADGIHPTYGGYSKMAARWYAALTGVPMTRWEAEKPAYTTINEGERLTTSRASGNGKAGYLAAPDSYLEFALPLPSGGRYRMYVRAADGMDAPCGQLLSVNGRPRERLVYRPYGWDQWTITAVDVWLNAGRNTIRFTRQTCSAEIDAIDLAPAR
ncbi:GDSL-type esterase/lipase family protein [Actinoallomurus soli]|uniref:GDSL-type esterase/lipase family protein n=1 Tax=Actinoallomurus soli TaxID=2952535 RepID=UPI0020920FDC|nr:GDSL-type esterase/lipase family protein [Actinoallomurus soli]MCO5973501.1 GDSL-type esterase/lipase family protein [Actinoallomurus soli]